LRNVNHSALPVVGQASAGSYAIASALASRVPGTPVGAAVSDDVWKIDEIAALLG
jgi:hypothetical protein